MLSSRPQQPALDAYFPTKTPSRGLKTRAENTIHPGTKTVGPKGKNVGLRTPFAPTSVQPNRLLKEALTGPSKQAIGSGRNVRPLGDRTPFPNHPAHTSPTETFTKIPKLVFLESTSRTPDVRPSSTRKHSRAPRSASKNFETPVNNGNHWDVSDGSVILSDSQIQETIVENDDFEEIEYMAPNNLDLPYQPPFDLDLPDYKVLGQTIRKLAFSVPFDDYVPPEIDVIQSDFPPPSWDLLSPPELDDDDPFHVARKDDNQGLRQNILTSSRPAGRGIPPRKVAPTTRPASAISTATTASRTRALSRVPSRLATTSSNVITTKTTPAVNRTTVLPSARVGQSSKLGSKAPASTLTRTRTPNITSTTGVVSSSCAPINPRLMTRPATSASLYRPSTTIRKGTSIAIQKLTSDQASADNVLAFNTSNIGLEDDFLFDV